MRIINSLKVAFVCLSLSLFAPVTLANTPEKTIENASNQLINALNKDKARLQANPKNLYGFVEAMILPYFDFDTMSQWIMGRSWHSATPNQRTRFTGEFKKLLINSYASTLLEYSDETIRVFPLPANARNGDEVTVRSELSSSKRAPVSINYAMIKSGANWLIYDVSVEGVSIVTSYRTEIRELVNAKGIDGMITTIAEKNK